MGIIYIYISLYGGMRFQIQTIGTRKVSRFELQSKLLVTEGHGSYVRNLVHPHFGPTLHDIDCCSFGTFVLVPPDSSGLKRPQASIHGFGMGL